MLLQAPVGLPRSAHVIVLGSEKGGSGKSTTAMHIAVALMKAGQRVATIDLDCRQQSLTRDVTNRGAGARRTGLDIKIPTHSRIEFGQTVHIGDNEASECRQFTDAVSDGEQ